MDCLVVMPLLGKAMIFPESGPSCNYAALKEARARQENRPSGQPRHFKKIDRLVIMPHLRKDIISSEEGSAAEASAC